jgi:hypothetical protein
VLFEAVEGTKTVNAFTMDGNSERDGDRLEEGVVTSLRQMVESIAHFALSACLASTSCVRYLHTVTLSVPALSIIIQLLVLYFGKCSAGLT